MAASFPNDHMNNQIVTQSPYNAGIAAGLAGLPPEACPHQDADAGTAWLDGHDAGTELRGAIAGDHRRVLPHQVQHVDSAATGTLPTNYSPPPWVIDTMPRRSKRQ